MSTIAIDPSNTDIDDDTKAIALLRAGVKATPELRSGLVVSTTLAIVIALWRMIVPIALQQILDRGLVPGKVDVGFVVSATAVAAVLIAALTLVVQRLNRGNARIRRATVRV